MAPLFRIYPFGHFRNIDRNDPQPSIRQNTTDDMNGFVSRMSQDKATMASRIFRVIFNDLSMRNGFLNFFKANIFFISFLLSMRANLIFIGLDRLTKFINVHKKLRALRNLIYVFGKRISSLIKKVNLGLLKSRLNKPDREKFNISDKGLTFNVNLTPVVLGQR